MSQKPRRKKRPSTFTEKHRAIYEFLISFKTENGGVSPTVREICAACGISTTSVADWRLLDLEDLGLIERPRFGRTRDIRLIGEIYLSPEDVQDLLDRVDRIPPPHRGFISRLEFFKRGQTDGDG